MRRSTFRLRPVRWMPLSVAWLGAVVVSAGWPAFGQVPEPHVPDITQRSGLFTRIIPIEPHLPPDKLRDQFYNTRWADHPQVKHPNNPCQGGLYGFPLKSQCTAAVYPYFYGSPGGSTITPECRAWHPRVLRLAQGLVKPFKPVGMYYDQGLYVPLYDLDPLVPGPGPYPWPWYYNHHGG